MKISRPIKIAIADDHAIFKQGIEAVLKFSPDLKLVINADNGAHLLDLIKHNQPDVILLDLRMPVMDGIAVLPEIRKRYPAIPVIILSLLFDNTLISAATKMGANAYLSKTADPDTITSTIRNCYNDGFFLKPVA